MSLESFESSTTIPIQTWMLALQPARSESREGPRDEELLARRQEADADRQEAILEPCNRERAEGGAVPRRPRQHCR